MLPWHGLWLCPFGLLFLTMIANVCLCVCTHIFTYSFYLFPLVFLIHKPKEKIRCCDHHAERARWVALISSFSHSGMRLKASYKSHQVSQPVLHLVDILWSLWLASCCLGLTLSLSSWKWCFLWTTCFVLVNSSPRRGFHFLLLPAQKPMDHLPRQLWLLAFFSGLYPTAP